MSHKKSKINKIENKVNAIEKNLSVEYHLGKQIQQKMKEILS